LLLTAILLLIPLTNLSFTFSLNTRESLVGLGVTAVAFILSFTVYLLVARGLDRPWVGFASSCFDVTLVSGALAIFLAFNAPHTAVNSKVVFEGYFLAIGATGLRYDRRICRLVGVLAISEYFAIVTFASVRWDLNNDVYAPFTYGMFAWSSQISRLILILTASLLSDAVVSRTQQLLRLSTSDPLTSLFNRGYFDERIAVEISRARRYRQPLSIAMMDVDYFKLFNDTHGHVAGDAALRVIASTLRHSFRQSDIVVRYGGEEFVIVMPQTDTTAAGRKLESVRQAVASAPIHLTAPGEAVNVTVSAGLAGLPNDGLSAEELLNVADTRLFRAKGAGRNRIVVT
jgi:diguanylate cyclase (GGDEF)-like protein